MTDTSLVEYLLRVYIDNRKLAAYERKRKNDTMYAYYDAKANLAYTILKEKCKMLIHETDTEYIAFYNECGVRVKKEDVRDDDVNFVRVEKERKKEDK